MITWYVRLEPITSCEYKARSMSIECQHSLRRRRNLSPNSNYPNSSYPGLDYVYGAGQCQYKNESRCSQANCKKASQMEEVDVRACDNLDGVLVNVRHPKDRCSFDVYPANGSGPCFTVTTLQMSCQSDTYIGSDHKYSKVRWNHSLRTQ